MFRDIKRSHINFAANEVDIKASFHKRKFGRGHEDFEITLLNSSYHCIASAEITYLSTYYEPNAWADSKPACFKSYAVIKDIKPGEQVVGSEAFDKCVYFSGLEGLKITLTDGSVFQRSLTLGGRIHEFQLALFGRLPQFSARIPQKRSKFTPLEVPEYK